MVIWRSPPGDGGDPLGLHVLPAPKLVRKLYASVADGVGELVVTVLALGCADEKRRGVVKVREVNGDGDVMEPAGEARKGRAMSDKTRKRSVV